MFEITKIALATANSGMKYQDRDDVLLIKLPIDTAIAGVFSQSSLTAAPVNWCKKIIKNGKARALIVNAVNANSFTGEHGDQALLKIVKEIAKLFNCKIEEVFVSSTGVIGEKLPYQKIINSLPSLEQNLSINANSWKKAAKAIMTTDLVAKYYSKKVRIAETEVKINGFAKGSGMIAPNMATMLAYIFTDANIQAKVLQQLLSQINEETFNSITVDSDHSTNDTVLLFATCQAGSQQITDINHPDLVEFKKALKAVMLSLAQQIVSDGEGATKLITVKVIGADSQKSAKNIALSIANSPLVKTAIAGADPNWGRIIMAIGKSQEKVDQNKLAIKIGECLIVKDGELSPDYVEDKAHQHLKGKEVQIEVDINLTPANQKILNSSTIWTCDLTEDYIKINKDYRN